MKKKPDETSRKAEVAMEQLVAGEKSINQIRNEFGMPEVNDIKLSKPIIKA